MWAQLGYQQLLSGVKAFPALPESPGLGVWHLCAGPTRNERTQPRRRGTMHTQPSDRPPWGLVVLLSVVRSTISAAGRLGKAVVPGSPREHLVSFPRLPSLPWCAAGARPVYRHLGIHNQIVNASKPPNVNRETALARCAQAPPLHWSREIQTACSHLTRRPPSRAQAHCAAMPLQPAAGAILSRRRAGPKCSSPARSAAPREAG